MSCKKTMLSCASAIALSLAMAQSAAAAEGAAIAAAEASAAQAPAAVEPDVPATEAAPIETQAPALAAPPPAAPPPMEPREMAKSPEEHWKAQRAQLNKRYEDLRARAAEAGMNFPAGAPWDREPEWLTYGEMRNQMQERGIELPVQPAWPGPMGMSNEERQAARDALQDKIGKIREMRKEMAAMTAEVREAFREQRYREMRERAASRGMELPEVAPWKQPPAAGSAAALPEPPAQQPVEADWGKYQEIIAGMTPEEREACMAMHRMRMQKRMQRPRRSMLPPEGYGPGYGHGYGRGWGQ